MSLDWQTFKSALGPNTSVTYIDEEYSEIPIDSECEFQEALRLAGLSKKSLRIIIYDHKSQSSQKRYLSLGLPAASDANPEEKFVLTKMSAISNSPSVKETCCHCKEDGEPEWFTNYMKRFKKQLFHELKSYIHNAIHSTTDKEKRLTTPKSDTHDVGCKKNESLFLVGTPSRFQEKDSPDIIDQREVKLQRKLEKLRTSKSERLEKLDNKIFKSFNEEWLLKEARFHSKRKFSRTKKVASEKKSRKGSSEKKSRKSIFFHENGHLRLSPGSEFSFNLKFVNDGNIRWSNPRLECFEVDGLCPSEISTSLPRLSPMQSSSVILTGVACKSKGLHYFRCRAVDGSETFGPEFICRARVGTFKTVDKSSGVLVSSKASHGTTGEARKPVGVLTDFEKDVITSSQKKIKENIIEIQKRLHDIDLLRPSTSMESDVKNSEERVNDKGEKWKTGCDSLQDLGVREKSLKEKLEQEKVPFGIDCLSLNQPINEACDLETSEETGNRKTDNLDNITNNVESEHGTDSEMSVIFVSEEEDEEETFIVIPSKSPSPANSVNREEVSPERESKSLNEQPEESKAKSANEKDIAKKETEQQKEKIAEGYFCHTLLRSRHLPFGEGIFQPKKIKSKSTQYHFTTENLTHPTFVQYPEGIFEMKPPAFMFTAGEEENSQKHKPEKREDCKEKRVPKTSDALGRVIYAVNSNGCCMPMEHVLKDREQTKRPTGVPPRVGGRSAGQSTPWPQNQERRSDRSAEIPSASPLSNGLMNRASNVASIAFNTAKSVINNLQSAFVSEGKTETRHMTQEAQESVLNEALIRLCDMGFLNIDLNRELLLLKDNDLVATVEELIGLQPRE